MSDPLVVLLADGRSKDKHIDNPYLKRIGGEPLIKRTARQFTRAGYYVVILSRDDEVLQAAHVVRGVSFHTPSLLYEDRGGVAMIPKAIDRMWARNSVAVFGDVVFTDEAVSVITNNEVEPGSWAVYGRSTDNRITGTPWAEWFAFELTWGTRGRARKTAEAVVNDFMEGKLKRNSPWEWYYYMEGWPPGLIYKLHNPKKMPTDEHWVEINDATDDIDFEEDYENIRRLYE